MTSLLDQLLLVPDNAKAKFIKVLTENPLTFVGIEKLETPVVKDHMWQIAWAIDGPETMKMISSASPYTLVDYLVKNLGQEITSTTW